MSDGFQKTLDHIRSIAGSEAEKGRLFERLMKAYFVKDPLYAERFSDVRLWSEWAGSRPGFDAPQAGEHGCCFPSGLLDAHLGEAPQRDLAHAAPDAGPDDEGPDAGGMHPHPEEMRPAASRTCSSARWA